MTVREFVKALKRNYTVSIREQGKTIFKMNAAYIDGVKEELLDRKIKECGIEICRDYIEICLQPKEPLDE